MILLLTTCRQQQAWSAIAGQHEGAWDDGPVGKCPVRARLCEYGFPSSRTKAICQQLDDVQCGLELRLLGSTLRGGLVLTLRIVHCRGLRSLREIHEPALKTTI